MVCCERRIKGPVKSVRKAEYMRLLHLQEKSNFSCRFTGKHAFLNDGVFVLYRRCKKLLLTLQEDDQSE